MANRRMICMHAGTDVMCDEESEQEAFVLTHAVII